MASNLKLLVTKLNAKDLGRLAQVQRLEPKRRRLEKQEKELTQQLGSVTSRRERLDRRIDSILGGGKKAKYNGRSKKRTVSAAARKKMAAAARRRWAKAKKAE